MEQAVRLVGLLVLLLGVCQSEEIHTTKVFIMTIGPWFFNWTDTKCSHYPGQFTYRPSLLDAPDLPTWMYYSYSERHSRGFVYGAPPPNQKDLEIEVIGLDRKTYEARQRVIKLDVIEKAEPALYEVHLKVDKLSVEDMLDSDRYNRLLNVFRKTLWPDSQDDLYITFLASALQVGSRLPISPFEGEGVMIHIGSRAPFSQTLQDLQNEVRPLRSKGQTFCPDFKHTSVERFFKQYNFSLDWCAFQLSEKKTVEEPPHYEMADFDPVGHNTQVWHSVTKQDLPTRDYLSELALTLAIPLLCFFVVISLLTFVLCFQQGSLKRNEETSHTSLVQYEAVQRASNTLRSLSNQRDDEEGSPRVSLERTGIRPEPPPYSGVQQSARDELMDDEDTKTWFC